MTSIQPNNPEEQSKDKRSGATAIGLAAGNGFLAVVLGAFGSHVLKDRLAEDAWMVYQTAVQYHFYHIAGLILAGVMLRFTPSSVWLPRAVLAFMAGIILFSGSLYLLAVTSFKPLAWLTPIGGISLIAGWVLVMVSVWREQRTLG